MKTTCLLFLTISWAALTHGTDYAAPSGLASQPTPPGSSANAAGGHPRDAGHAASPREGRHQTGGTASERPRDRARASDTSRPPSGASVAKANRPRQISNGPKRSLPGIAGNLHRPGSDKFGGAAKSGLIQNETVHNALTVRTSSVFRPTGPWLNNARPRGPNPAVIGGSAISHSRDTWAINGTHMSRKP